MKMKSFVAGLYGGIDGAVEVLDSEVRKTLGDDVIIHSVTDTHFTEAQNYPGTPSGPRLVRVVVYSFKKK